jgi:hypothetical protein
MQNERQENINNGDRVPLARRGESTYKLIPFQSSNAKNSLQPPLNKRVAVRLGNASKAAQRRLDSTTQHEDPTSTVSFQTVEVEKLPEEQALVNVFEKLLAEYLHIKKSSQATEVAELMRTERRWVQDHEASLQTLKNQLKQYAQLRYLQDQKYQRAMTRFRWLVIGLGAIAILGILGTIYGLFFS